MPPHRSGSSSGLVPALLAGAFVVAVHGLWALAGGGPVLDGALSGPDSYLRLVRVTVLAETGAWFDPALPRGDAPFGTTLHWSRPLDVLLLGLSAPLLPVLGFERALFWAGVVIGPLLHLAAALALAWAAKPLLGRWGAALAGGLTAAQPGLVGYAVIGRADHHVLFVLLAALAFGGSLRALTTRDSGPGAALAAGLVTGAGLWVGVEALVLAAVQLAVLGLFWCLGHDRHGRLNRAFTLGLLLAVIVALGIERGTTGWSIDYDRLSPVHGFLALLLAAFWQGPGRLAGRLGPVGRFTASGVGALIIVGATSWVFPGFAAGPMADVAPDLVALSLGHVAENQGMTDAGRFLGLAGGLLVGGPWAAWRLMGSWRRVETERWGWLLAGLGLVVYGGLAIAWLRWTPYLGLMLALPLADLIRRLDAAFDRREPGVGRALTRTATLAILIIGPLAAGLALGGGKEGGGGGATDATCRTADLAAILDAPPWNDRGRVILGAANIGPELLYRTRHAVVAMPYHRSSEGIRDAIGALTATDTVAARDRLKARQVDLVVLCPGSTGDALLTGDGVAETLYRRLVEGRGPAWAPEVTPALAGGYRLFALSLSPPSGG